MGRARHLDLVGLRASSVGGVDMSGPSCPVTLGRAVCTAKVIPRLKDSRVDSCVVIVWAYFCWRDGGGFAFASLSLTFGVADLCGCLNFGGFEQWVIMAVAGFAAAAVCWQSSAWR
ncbi:hypothetical protein NDU88_000961 [Pleurodeles waltl]|uniref:Uncharacterized protein n=1 Tax=Pleurodeles waltl TaxID=8319 RepID=A0AAV7TID3_PLEWA|nr:hypothetical protein NDU88_000961 [Pleurodeles waltl]